MHYAKFIDWRQSLMLRSLYKQYRIGLQLEKEEARERALHLWGIDFQDPDFKLLDVAMEDDAKLLIEFERNS